jgi:hypothetical protein
MMASLFRSQANYGRVPIRALAHVSAKKRREQLLTHRGRKRRANAKFARKQQIPEITLRKSEGLYHAKILALTSTETSIFLS